MGVNDVGLRKSVGRAETIGAKEPNLAAELRDENRLVKVNPERGKVRSVRNRVEKVAAIVTTVVAKTAIGAAAAATDARDSTGRRL